MNSAKDQHNHNKEKEKEDINDHYYCTCHLCESDYDSQYDSEYDSEYDSYSDYSTYSEYDDEEDIGDSDSFIDEEIWYDSDYFNNENLYNMRPHSGWDSTSIPRTRYHLPESVLQNNENVNFYVNTPNINNTTTPGNRNHQGNRSDNLLDQPPVRPLLTGNHSRQTTASSSATLHNPTGEEDNSTDDHRTYIPNRHANHPITENDTNTTTTNATPNSMPYESRRSRRRSLRHRHSGHPNLSNGHRHHPPENDHHGNDGGSSNTTTTKKDKKDKKGKKESSDDDTDYEIFPRRTNTNRNHSNRPKKSKRKIFFSHFMFVIALLSTLALVLFVQLFGYILTAADQARDVTLRLTNYNRQQTVCDNNDRATSNNGHDNNEQEESHSRSTENASSSIPNAEPDILFTEETSHGIHRQAHPGDSGPEETPKDPKIDETTDEDTEKESEEPERKKKEKEKETGNGNEKMEKEEKEKEKEEKEKEKEDGENDQDEKEKNDFLAHLASLRAAQALAGQNQPNDPNHLQDPTRLHPPTRPRNPSDPFSSYLSNYVYYNSDIYSP